MRFLRTSARSAIPLSDFMPCSIPATRRLMLLQTTRPWVFMPWRAARHPPTIPAGTIPLSVRRRCRTIPPAVPAWPQVPMRCSTTPLATPTWRWAMRRCTATRLEEATLLLATRRSIATLRVSIALRSGPMQCKTTSETTSIRRSAILRCKIIRSARTIRPWAMARWQPTLPCRTARRSGSRPCITRTVQRRPPRPITPPLVTRL